MRPLTSPERLCATIFFTLAQNGSTPPAVVTIFTASFPASIIGSTQGP
jgi:hypothetical protein